MDRCPGPQQLLQHGPVLVLSGAGRIAIGRRAVGVLRVLHASHQPLDVPQIMALLPSHTDAVTVYRTLKHMTQCGLALPLIILYEISVFSVKMVEPKVELDS